MKKNDALLKRPSKLFNLASMKPILLGVDGEARKILEQYNGVFLNLKIIKASKKFITFKDNHLVYNTCKEGCTSLANA